MESRICFLIIWLLYLPIISSQNVYKNTIDEIPNEIPRSENDEIKPKKSLESIATNSENFFQSNAAGDVGNILSNFLHSDGGKTMENILMGAMKNPDTTNQVLLGISSILNQNNAGTEIDPTIIGNVLSIISETSGSNQKSNPEQLTENIMNFMTNMITSKQHNNKANANDILGSVASTVSNIFTDSGENPISLFISSLNSFIGPDADKRKSQHESHAYLLPPLLEKAHLYFDHFRHTELYRALWRITGADKIFHMFATDGKFNFVKFFDRLENKNFRKHWIHVVTQKITDIIAFVTDSSRYKQYVNTVVSLFNGFLKSANFPKSTLFDISRPNETLTNFFNFFLKKYLTMDINSEQYVRPAVIYVEDVLRLAHNKGFLFKNGLNSKELAHKLTDTFNLEIIEPILRVWRAYRFAKKVPECDKYVMCLINQEDIQENVSLPGLKTSLSKTASMLASWFLSEKTGTSFWTLYSTINDETDCSVRFLDKCNNFHIEEVKVDSDYNHTEL